MPSLKKWLASWLMAKNKLTYRFGEVFVNPYLGNKTTEVLNINKKRVGWIWTHTDGRIIVSPNLGFYVWYGPNGEQWTTESGANWLVNSRKGAIIQSSVQSDLQRKANLRPAPKA